MSPFDLVILAMLSAAAGAAVGRASAWSWFLEWERQAARGVDRRFGGEGRN